MYKRRLHISQSQGELWGPTWLCRMWIGTLLGSQSREPQHIQSSTDSRTHPLSFGYRGRNGERAKDRPRLRCHWALSRHLGVHCRGFWSWFAAVKLRSTLKLRPEGRGSEQGWGTTASGGAQAGSTVGADYGLSFRRVKRVGDRRRAERILPVLGSVRWLIENRMSPAVM